MPRPLYRIGPDVVILLDSVTFVRTVRIGLPPHDAISHLEVGTFGGTVVVGPQAAAVDLAELAEALLLALSS